MARNPDNSKWYIPLFAGTETSSRGGALTQYDPDELIGQLPDNCTQPGMILWLDAAQASSIKLANGAVWRWLDRSGAANHNTQPNADLRPAKVGASVSFED